MESKSAQVKPGQKSVVCPLCGGKHLVRWNFKQASTKCPKTKALISLEVR